MSEPINLYCDESCHLEKDRIPVMVLGALACPASHARELSLKVRELKRQHGLADNFEIKWSKVSPGGLTFYLALLDLFFADDQLSFRGLVVPNKGVLRHEAFQQTHDDFYYKMYYLLLRPMPKEQLQWRVFLDIKDTRGGAKVHRLEQFLHNHLRDFASERILGVQQAHSRELVPMQLADLLIGALGYVHRGYDAAADRSAAKKELIARVRKGASLTLKWSTAPGRKKFDIFVWEANQQDASQ